MTDIFFYKVWVMASADKPFQGDYEAMSFYVAVDCKNRNGNWVLGGRMTKLWKILKAHYQNVQTELVTDGSLKAQLEKAYVKL